MDVGTSLNPAVDVGQIEGAFVQGYGLWTMEDNEFASDTGYLRTSGPSSYKIPTAMDIPREINVVLLSGSSNKHAVFSSKVSSTWNMEKIFRAVSLSMTYILCIQYRMYSREINKK